MEQEHTLWQLTVVKTILREHALGNRLVVALCHEFLNALALLSLEQSIELAIESKLLDVVKILLLKVCCRHVVIRIHKGKHVLEHTACRTRCRHEFHNLLAFSLVVVPRLDILLHLLCRRSHYASTDGSRPLKLEEGETRLKFT